VVLLYFLGLLQPNLQSYQQFQVLIRALILLKPTLYSVEFSIYSIFHSCVIFIEMQIYELICYPLTLSTLYAWIYRLKHTQRKLMLIILNNLRSQRANRQIAIKTTRGACVPKKLKDMKTVFIRFLASGSIE
jgi:hypothetical protein